MDWMELFTLVTGVAYLILEIRQKNFMWIVGILTGGAAVVVFARQRLFASMLLNCYYVAVSFWGFWKWRQDARLLASGRSGASSEGDPSGNGGDAGDAIHLERLDFPTAILSLVLLVACSGLSVLLLRLLGDPMSLLDSVVAVLSAIATWWLGRSFKEQWLLWIVADSVTTLMCIRGGMSIMAVLYAVYAVSAVFGYFHWSRKGVYVS